MAGLQQQQYEGIDPSLVDPLVAIRACPEIDDEQRRRNMRSSLVLGLVEAGTFRKHDLILSVIGGGPSLENTYQDIAPGYVAAVNGSLAWLLERGIVPNACGVLDPGPHMPGIIVPRSDVHYFVASICDPALFQHLSDCRVILWHPSGVPGGEAIVRNFRSRRWLLIGGGCTMGLRWVPLGYAMGFRTFHLHGMDSSFRNGSTHAYPDRRDKMPDRLTIDGFETRANFASQVVDFVLMLERFSKPDIEPVTIKVFGDGLLQSCWRKWLEKHPGAYGTC